MSPDCFEVPPLPPSTPIGCTDDCYFFDEAQLPEGVCTSNWCAGGKEGQGGRVSDDW